MKLDGLACVKRLVVYFFYDKDGIVDRYVQYMLDDVKKNCSELFVICNGKLTQKGRSIFEKMTPHVMVRENKGFDVWAYKAALEHYGWERLSQFDEVVLMDSTLYGPLYPLAEMFKEMNKRDLDFWGITKHYKIPFDPYGTTGLNYVPEHIQSSFICVRKKMLGSIEFHDYWEGIESVSDYREAIGRYEAVFTKKFNDYGYISDTYVQSDDLEPYTRDPLMFEIKELIQNRKCPVFKRKAFNDEYYEFLDSSSGEAVVEAFYYIKEHFDYDLDMVWENLLRTSNMADVKDRLHLNYVLPKQYAIRPEVTQKVKTALFMHLYFEDLIDNSIEYANAMPENADIYFTVCSDKMYSKVKEAGRVLSPRKVKVIRIENRGRDVSALLVGAAPYVNQYDVACFTHDKKTTQVKPYTSGQSFAYRCLENTLGSKTYVANIIDKFDQEPRLGMMMPPPPNHSIFYDGFGGEWTNNFENVVHLAEKLNIHVDMDSNKDPIAPLGTMFWFRPEALKPLFEKNWRFKDFPEEPNDVDGTLLHAIERIYAFTAQSQGFYEAWVMNDSYASIELTNCHFMLRELTKALHNTNGYYLTFAGMMQSVWSGKRFAYPRRIKIKRKIKKVIPLKVWNVLRSLYNKTGGTKWRG